MKLTNFLKYFNNVLKELITYDWVSFMIVMAICYFGVLDNKNILNIRDLLFVCSCFGIPVGLFFAYINKD